MNENKPPVQIKTQAPADIRESLIKLTPQFAAALPPHITAEKFVRVALTAIHNNPDLLQKDRTSLFSACMKTAQDGLLPDGREAALVAYGNTVAYLPMVAGLLKKIRNSGEISMITAQVVHANDPFSYHVDSDGEHLDHKPLLFGDRGEIIGVYALAKTKDGDVYVEVLTLSEIDKIRNASRSGKAGPWVQWWDQMAKKTAIRRLAKRLPMSTDVEETIRADDHMYDLNKPALTVAPQEKRLTTLIKQDEAATIEDPGPEGEPA